MKARRMLLTAITLLILAAICVAQPKITTVKPGVTTQWMSDTDVIITTTVTQQVSTKQLLREKQQLLHQITQYQLLISGLQERVLYIDLINASYADPNEP